MSTTQKKLYLVIDTETTGLTNSDKAVSICAIIVDEKGLQVGSPWYRLVNPGMRSNPRSFALHGLSEEMLSDKPTLEQLLPELNEMAKGAKRMSLTTHSLTGRCCPVCWLSRGCVQ